MEVLRLKRVEVTDSWGVEFIAAKGSQGGSLGLVILLAVHFLWDRKSSLRKPSLHFLVWKWFLTDPDRELWVINHFENRNSLGLAPSLSSVQRDQQTKAPLPVHSLLSTPETQMWMKKGIMLERQLGGGGRGRGKGWRKRREEGEGKQNPNRLHFQEVQPWKKEGKVSLPSALSKSV